ncbi:MAG: endonuclease [Shinella sp.]|nr:MAG: endonuclease [Shinella sp.]
MRTALCHSALTLVTLALVLLASRFFLTSGIVAVAFSLHLHIAVLCVVACALALVLRRGWYGWLMLSISLGMVGYGVILMQSHALPAATASDGAGGVPFRVLSFNVLFTNDEGGSEVADIVLASGADVVSLMEAGPVRPYLDRLRVAYPYQLGCSTTGPRSCDLVLLSRHPFRSAELGTLSNLWPERLALAVIDLAGRPVNIVAAHLSKPYYDDYHNREARRLARRLEKLEGPLVLSGDFNASVLAPDMQGLLRRSGLRTLPLEPATWPVGAAPVGLAIDHIFARPPMRLVKAGRIGPAGSNHYGLIADMLLFESAGG